MRPHGRATVSIPPRSAWAVCERCRFLYDHSELRWQMRYRGPRLQNIRLLVCRGCYDTPNEQERLIVLPVDPVSIANVRPDNYVLADNPLSPLNYDVRNEFFPATSLGGSIGTLNNLDAAFNGAATKVAAQCAGLSVSQSSFANTVGKNWNADPSGITSVLASTVAVITHTAASFTATAPIDRPFLATGATGWLFQGSSNNSAWNTLSSGTTVGKNGEVLTITNLTGAPYQYHQLSLQGDGVNAVAIAQLAINVSDGPTTEI